MTECICECRATPGSDRRSVRIGRRKRSLGYESTIDAMAEDEKVGQLFINLNNRFDDDFVNHIVDTYHPGGMRYNHTDSASVQAHIRHAQSRSKIPLLVASNIEAGGNGACTDGTHVATPLQTASTPDTDAARQMGLVGARESRALGCNWAFTPIVDIHSNWRNTVIATRAFGNDHETVITYAQAYCDGVREGAGDRPMALCMKHFPGDGRDERDQHVVTSYNDCSVEEWDASYRKIWEWGIGAGIESIMVGHIMLPEYSRKLRPGIKDADILPATVSPELLTDLLRNDLGFQRRHPYRRLDHGGTHLSPASRASDGAGHHRRLRHDLVLPQPR